MPSTLLDTPETEHARRVRDAVDDGVYAAKRAVKAVSRGVHELGDLRDEAAYRVKRNPLKSVGLALGAGFALGALVGWIAHTDRSKP